jgi:hypothetical protein
MRQRAITDNNIGKHKDTKRSKNGVKGVKPLDMKGSSDRNMNIAP